MTAKANVPSQQQEDSSKGQDVPVAALGVGKSPRTETPSISVSLFVTWILPVLFIAIVSRYGVDTEPPSVKPESRPFKIDLSKASGGSSPTRNRDGKKMMGSMMSSKTFSAPAPSPHPTSYQQALDQIKNRKRLWKPKKKNKRASVSRPSTSSTPTPHKSTSTQAPVQPQDPQRVQLENAIKRRREAFRESPNDVFKALQLADALRQKDLKYHDGGMGQQEALEAYQQAVELTLKRRQKMLDNGEATNLSLSGTKNVAEELLFDYTQKSVDGLLCAIYTGMGKMYFMANMFERAVESYTKCIELEPLYLDAVGSRGSSLIILGKYEEAGKDFTTVIDHDEQHFFNDVYTGMAKVLAAKEEAVPQGWDPMIENMKGLIDQYEVNMSQTQDKQSKVLLAEALNRLHHVMFSYHDTKTKDRDKAWAHLTSSYKYKMSVIEPWDAATERQKLMTTKTVFHKAFWPAGIGSRTRAPIFIIGFVRSGSTLLERVLDAHPQIVGTGEDSVFNGRLDQIRNSIVQASLSGDLYELQTTVQELADSVVSDMRQRCKIIAANTAGLEDSGVEPERLADKMLTNYFNVGFIHMLFPNALILHVARNPMDVIWSAYKHEFPAGGLDYTSNFESLADMYHSYRSVIDHWDTVLPGRITHVRYEDLVNDMPGIARAIINATGLEWDESVLDFHKKKHAVNTLSTTQVRQGIYKHSMEAWKKYEKQLQPLVKLVGTQTKWELKTTLLNYQPSSY